MKKPKGHNVAIQSFVDFEGGCIASLASQTRLPKVSGSRNQSVAVVYHHTHIVNQVILVISSLKFCMDILAAP